MTSEIRIAIVCGGPSAEAEVSRASGAEVAMALAGRFDHVTTLEYGADLSDRLRDAGTQVVFPVMHGPPGEDGTLQGFLDTIGMPMSAAASSPAPARWTRRSPRPSSAPQGCPSRET